MKISIGSDHGGFLLKEELKEYLDNKNIEVVDFGTSSLDSCDYPDYALPVCVSVIENNTDFGILICTTGIGMSIAANKVDGIRAALVSNVEGAHLTREHNNANVLCLSAKFTSSELAKQIVDEFLTTEFSNESRHVRRVNKVSEIEKR